MTSFHMPAQNDSSIESKIDNILSQLTIEEKVAMCHAQSKFSSPGVARLGIPELWMSDGPHGVRGEINWDDWGYAGWTNDYATAFPALTCLAATFNPDLSKEYGNAVSEEALYREKDVLLGPGVNIYRTPLNGRNFEYMGEDPYLASKMVVPYIHGVQQNGVAACLKHYVLNNQEVWRNKVNVKISDRALYEIYMPAFKAGVQEGKVWSIMGAYNKFEGQYCCHNERLLNKILKEDWAFDGAVITDWGGATNTKEAALYGLDLEMGSHSDGLTVSAKYAYDYYYLANPYLEMLKSGEVPISTLDNKVRRILRLMFRTTMNPNRGFGVMNNQEHLDVARKIGGEGIVLLKNEGNFFPIDPVKNITIAIIGENATKQLTPGGGSSELKAKDEVSPLRGIKERFKNAEIIHAMGYNSGPPQYGKVIPPKLDNDSLKTAAISAAKQADLVLFIGGLNKNHYQDCEGGDRLDYGLPFGQDELLDEVVKANPNTGVILISGNAVEMPWLGKIKGLMQAWFLGSQSGHAIADVISGEVNPSGKLPFTFPVKLEDNAAHYYGEISYPGIDYEQEYKEDILVGYRWHDTKKIKPQFAFGHGLSYTEFQLFNLEINSNKFEKGQAITLSCSVQNTGQRPGAEVIQVYVGKNKSKVPRALKELKGFKKIFLEPGATENVEIAFNTNDLAFYDESISDWSLEEGSYTVYVGNASDNVSRTFKIRIK
ncbi:MAG: glycosyl hydrolase [Flavobacteriaceae bacterium]|nr:glycoside hydrolase family 3 C-terminal domain-containing protein [Bacteroidia bacterium]NNF76150.1 glycosyl hydrolase [Flavobacteriaceae bacterium]